MSPENASPPSPNQMRLISMILGGLTVSALSLFVLARDQAGSKTSTVQRHLDRCIVYYHSGNLPRAIAELRKAQRLLPNDPDINFMLGNALYRRGDMRGAADAYGKTLTHSPNHFEAHMSRGFALFEVEELHEALAEWLAATRLDPNEPFARAGLAVGLYGVGREDEARAQYAMVRALDSRYGDPERLRVDIRWKPKTLNIIKRLLELLPSK